MDFDQRCHHDGAVSGSQTLLEHLAATAWFAKNGEIALTSGLAFCLTKDSAASEAFVKLVRSPSIERLRSPSVWQPESPGGEAGRVDLAGLIVDVDPPAPVVFVEAKVAASFSEHQVADYVLSQQRRLTTSRIECGAMLILVPEGRVQMCWDELRQDLALLQAKPSGSGWLAKGQANIWIRVLSWDEALSACIAVDGPARGDLEQLLGACRALRGADVPAFSAEDLAGKWTAREPDLQLIIDRVTREVSSRLAAKLFPWRPNAAYGMAGGHRYVIAEEGGQALAVGVRVDAVDPPLWVRWHQETPDIDQVPARLEAAGVNPVIHEGHLWAALAFHPDDGAATRQIASLVNQVEALYGAASGRSEVVQGMSPLAIELDP